MAQWIRHMTTDQEILGSSPGEAVHPSLPTFWIPTIEFDLKIEVQIKFCKKLVLAAVRFEPLPPETGA